MNQKGTELMGCELLANRDQVPFGHLQGKYVVGDMPLAFGVEIMCKPLAAGIGQAADRRGLAFGDCFDFGIALHLAFEAVR